MDEKGQRIKIKIAEREYEIYAPSPESEELIRLAANTINSKINAYQLKYVGKSMVDILSFVALNESIGSISSQRKYNALLSELRALAGDTENYLKRQENK